MSIISEMTREELSNTIMYYDFDKPIFADATIEELKHCIKVNPFAINLMEYEIDNIGTGLYALALSCSHVLIKTIKIPENKRMDVFEQVYKNNGLEFFILEKKNLTKLGLYDTAMNAVNNVIYDETVECYKSFIQEHDLKHTPDLFKMWAALYAEKNEILKEVLKVSSYYTYGIRQLYEDETKRAKKISNLTDLEMLNDYKEIATNIIVKYGKERDLKEGNYDAK